LIEFQQEFSKNSIFNKGMSKMVQKLHFSGNALVLAGAFCWSLNSPIVKYLTLDPLFICGLRSLIAGLVLLPFLKLREINKNKWLPIYLLSYCGLCLSVILALSLTSPAIGVGMQYTASMWIFFGTCLYQHSFSKKQALPVAVIALGVCCFMLSGGQGDSNSLGNLIAASEGIFFAGMTLSSKKVTMTNVLGMTSLANLFTAFVVFLLFPQKLSGITAMSIQESILMIIMGVVQVAGGYGLYNLGVQKIPAQRASLLALLELLLGPFWVVILLGQYPAPIVMLGLIIIFAGLILELKIDSFHGIKKIHQPISERSF
jgi:DME family drug/metabolite transporter